MDPQCECEVFIMFKQTISIVGAGVIARAHAAAAAKLPGKVTLCVTDPNLGAVREFITEYPSAMQYPDLATMFERQTGPDDIVVIATPPFAHFKAACEALSSGRHVLCEKPLALTVDQAEQMQTLARSNNRMLGCCSTRFMGQPTTLAVKHLLDRGAIGTVYHMTFIHKSNRSRSGIEYQPSSQWFLEETLSGGGTLMDWGPYDFATIHDVLAPVKLEVLSAWTARPITAADPMDAINDVEQHLSASLRYTTRDGGVIDVSYQRAACTHGSSQKLAEIEGTRGAIRWDWISTDGGVTVTVDQSGSTVESTEFPVDFSGLGRHDKPLVYFDKVARGGCAPAIVNQQALFNFSCIRAIYLSAASGERQVVNLQV
jgi:predicted dehydrogenase